MKAAIISLGSVSSQWTAEAMKKYFTTVDIISLKQLEVQLGKGAGVYYQEKELGQYDCIYLKGSFRYAHLLRSIATLLEKKIPYMPLAATAFTIVHHKLLTHLILQQHNIHMPKTYLSPSIAEAKQLLNTVHYPIVMKFPEGTQGKGVMFADSKSSASSLLDALEALRQPFIIQEYIDTSGTDIRAFVVGEKVVASMKRKAQTGESSANIHAGGTGEGTLLKPETQKVALAVARALRAEVCAVDILETPLGPLVLEANISPGLQGIQKVTPINIADQIAKHFYSQTEKAVSQGKKTEAQKMMQEMKVDGEGGQDIISEMKFRGDKIILPELINKICKFNDGKEYLMKVKKGKLIVEEMSL